LNSSPTEKVQDPVPHHMIPSVLYIRLFRRCNSNCVMCRCKQRSADSVKNPGKIKAAFGLLAKGGIKEIRITGGEPLLYDGLEDIIALCKDNQTHVKILTNGTLLTRHRAESLVKAGAAEFVISLDGPNHCIHDRLRGKTGLFDSTIKGIKALRHAGERNVREIVIGVTTIISKANYRSIPDFPGLLQESGCNWWTWNTIKDYPSLLLQMEEIMDFYRLAEDVKDKLLDSGIKLMVPKADDGSTNIYIYGLTDAEIEASAKGTYPANFNCNVVRNVGFADFEDDRLYACPLTVHRDNPYSREFNAVEDSLQSVWSDPLYLGFRSRFSKETHIKCSGCEPALRLLHQEL
jgi:MoaA/NifB/PqqE/SkfB family radical SAM enzyme